MRNKNVQYITQGGIIAALYVVLTYIAAAMGLASGAIQVRLSEVLCILPALTPAAIPGLTVGCVLANALTGCALWDVVFGSVATLIGAIGTRILKKYPKIAWIPPVISNMVIVPIVLMKVYGVGDVEMAIPWSDTVLRGSGFWPLMLTVGIGEVISCGLIGWILYKAVYQRIPGLEKN